MALDPISTVRLLVGDVVNSPFYQLFSDSDIQQFLDMNGQNIMQAARLAAISASMQLAGWNTRERMGNEEIWNSLSSNYLKALDNLIQDNSSANLPNGLMPYASGISWADVNANNCNLDNISTSIKKVNVCDYVWINGNDVDNSCGC